MVRQVDRTPEEVPKVRLTLGEKKEPGREGGVGNVSERLLSFRDRRVPMESTEKAGKGKNRGCHNGPKTLE